MKNDQLHRFMTRRQLLGNTSMGVGAAALASLLNPQLFAVPAKPQAPKGIGGFPNLKAKAKRVIYMVMSGAPSQMDLFDHKPALKKLHKTELPASIRQGQRLTTMTSGQGSFPVADTIFKFAQHGKSGAWVSEAMPYIAKIADELCFIKSMHTEAINHDQAITFFQTGAQQPGRPSFGAWLSYGLGSDNADLPAYVVLTSIGSGRPDCQPLYDRLWGTGFLPSEHQGVRFRSVGDPVIHLSNPQGVTKDVRRGMLDDLSKLNKIKHEAVGDPEIATRISQYELAFRMQASVPDLMDLSKEPKSTFDLYGEDAKKPGKFAFNALMARRLCERGVRFVQLYHRGWDQHAALPQQLRGQCKDTDQPTAALIMDLKKRGLLDDTLIVWGGEFGRTVYSQGAITADSYGRDHHPRCFTLFLAGGGIKSGISYGETDDFCYNVTKDPVHVHDLNATILHCLGIDHTKLVYRFQGRDFRLTDVHGHVVKPIIA